MPDLVSTVRRRLAESADPARAPQMQAYMKSEMPFRGVGAQPMRAVCREVFAACPLLDRDAWERAVRELWDGARFREERYAAVELTGHRLYRDFQDPATLTLYRHLVVTGAWWDYVDGIAGNRVGPILRRYPAEVTPVVAGWAVDDDLWLRRTAVLSQLGSKADTDTDLLDHCLTSNLEGSAFGSEFFIRKALGWALREHAKTDPEWVRQYVDRELPRLSGLTRREALKHLGREKA